MSMRPSRPSPLNPAALTDVAGGRGDPGLRPSAGDDTLTGGSGNDIYMASGGHDLVYGGGGQDTIDGGEGQDSLFGESGNDTIAGGAGDDLMGGGSGDDTLAGGLGADTMEGSIGNDRFVIRPGEAGTADRPEVVQGGDGIDVLRLDFPGLLRSQVLAAIVPDPGSPAPAFARDGGLDVTGVSGTITLGDQVIRFSGLERIELPSLLDRARVAQD